MKKKKVTKSKKSKSVKKKVVVKKTNSGITPLADRVLVRPFTEDELKGGKEGNYGIIIPDTVTKEKSAQGKVIAVGEGRREDGKLIPIRVKVGDTVIFSKYGYDEVDFKGEELYLLKEDNILAILN